MVPEASERFGAWTGDGHDGYAAAFAMGALYTILAALIFRPKKDRGQGRAEATEIPHP
ncbi:hypothetical protein I6A60_02280 [Frankia sp. AgB1.9]|uniref:hypothetical protein n=1 Tax=unclassified Frankia TaxID=2632575 RepID=UPI0019334FAB|nr:MULTISPECIES: hypothetical protein [unclassified Frankia]MBL7546713.1 hypothetical protein [Frankia sp. AgB1.9]